MYPLEGVVGSRLLPQREANSFCIPDKHSCLLASMCDFSFLFFFNATKEMIQKERWCFASSHGFNTWISGSSLYCRIRGAKSHRPTAVLEQLGAALCPQLGPSPLGGQPPALSSHRCSVLSPSGSPCVCLQGSSKDMASGDWWAEAHEGPLGTG